MKHVWVFEYEIGRIAIAEENEKITDIFLEQKREFSDMKETQTPILLKAAKELEEYFKGTRQTFDVPLFLCGTPFQIAVWNALRAIPYGETRSYKQIAQQIGNPNACRAVGMANNRNPIMIMVPCHRVIGQNKSLTGYGGGLPMKEYLLHLEKVNTKTP